MLEDISLVELALGTSELALAWLVTCCIVLELVEVYIEVEVLPIVAEVLSDELVLALGCLVVVVGLVVLLCSEQLRVVSASVQVIVVVLVMSTVVTATPPPSCGLLRVV